MKYCNFPSMMILVAATANLSNINMAQAFGEDDLQLQAETEVSRMTKKENLQQQRDESRKLQNTYMRLRTAPDLEQKAGKTEAPSTSNVPSTSAEPSIEPSNLPTASAAPSTSLKELVLALLARVDTLESEDLALQSEVAALKSEVDALKSAQADVTACVTYDSGADVCTIGDDLTSGSGISFNKMNGNVSLKTNKGSFSANVAEDIILKGSDSYIGTGDADFNSGSGIRFEPKGNVSLQSGSSKVILKGTEAYIGNGEFDLSSGSGIRVNSAGSVFLKSSGGLTASVAEDIFLKGTDSVSLANSGTGSAKVVLKGTEAYIGTGAADLSSGAGVRFGFKNLQSKSSSSSSVSLDSRGSFSVNADEAFAVDAQDSISLESSQGGLSVDAESITMRSTKGNIYTNAAQENIMRGGDAKVVLKGTEAYIGTGAADLSSGAGVRFGFKNLQSKGSSSSSVSLDSRGSFSVNTDGLLAVDAEDSITMRSNKGGLSVSLQSSIGGLFVDAAYAIDMRGGNAAVVLKGTEAYIGNGSVDQTSGSGIRVNSQGDVSLKTNTGSFSANAAQDITMSGGNQVFLKGTEAYIGTGSFDQSTGSGIKFDRKGNASLKGNNGFLAANCILSENDFCA